MVRKIVRTMMGGESENEEDDNYDSCDDSNNLYLSPHVHRHTQTHTLSHTHALTSTHTHTHTHTHRDTLMTHTQPLPPPTHSNDP